MARGKHAASAAKRRAESAEDQLDRLLPQLVEAKTTARRYRAEAERATALAAEVKELRSTIGIPIARHEAALDALKTSHDEELLTIYEQFDAVVEHLVATVRRRLNGDLHRVVSPNFLDNIRALPADRGDRIMRGLGASRDEARAFLEPGFARYAANENHRDLLNVEGKAKSLGYDGIPRKWLDAFDSPKEQAEVG